jgi:hypothetical protein
LENDLRLKGLGVSQAEISTKQAANKLASSSTQIMNKIMKKENVPGIIKIAYIWGITAL